VESQVKGLRLIAGLLISQGIIWLVGGLISFGMLGVAFGVPFLIHVLGVPGDWVVIGTIVLYAVGGYHVYQRWDGTKAWFERRFPSSSDY